MDNADREQVLKHHIIGECKAMAPPLAGGSVDRGVEVQTTENFVNTAASGGCHARLLALLLFIVLVFIGCIAAETVMSVQTEYSEA